MFYVLYLLILLIVNGCLVAQYWDGAYYHVHSAMQESTAKALLDGVILKGKVLDIGCGSGLVTAYMASRTQGTVLGIDSSESMISFAQKNYKHVSNLSFETIDAKSWPFAQEEFDYIVSFSCLHWIEELQPVINNIAASLKETGIFIACLAPPTHFLFKPLIEVATSPTWTQYFKNPEQKPWYSHDPKSFTALLIQANLTPLNIEIWDKPTDSKNKDEFIAFLKGWMTAVPHVIQLPAELKDKFIEEVADHFLKTVSIAEDGSFTYITPYLLVKAQKPLASRL